MESSTFEESPFRLKISTFNSIAWKTECNFSSLWSFAGSSWNLEIRLYSEFCHPRCPHEKWEFQSRCILKFCHDWTVVFSHSFGLPNSCGLKVIKIECYVCFPNIFWVVVSNIFYFHPYLGKIPILTNIFHKFYPGRFLQKWFLHAGGFPHPSLLWRSLAEFFHHLMSTKS